MRKSIKIIVGALAAIFVLILVLSMFEDEEPEPVCGNDVLEQGEECDDGNNDGGDGCDENCMIEKTNFTGSWTKHSEEILFLKNNQALIGFSGQETLL